MKAAYASLWRSVFLLALLLELPIVAFLAPKPRRHWAVLASVIGNAITHPFLWFVWPRLFSYSTAVVVGEAFAVVLEGALLMIALKSKRGIAISFAANLYSYAVGELVMRVIAIRLMRYWYGGA